MLQLQTGACAGPSTSTAVPRTLRLLVAQSFHFLYRGKWEKNKENTGGGKSGGRCCESPEQAHAGAEGRVPQSSFTGAGRPLAPCLFKAENPEGPRLSQGWAGMERENSVVTGNFNQA